MSILDPSNDLRLKMLEQQLMIMQKEVNEVLAQVQMALQGFAKGTKLALETLDERLRKLEQTAYTTQQRSTEGKEI